jgi:hypothetical protein
MAPTQIQKQRRNCDSKLIRNSKQVQRDHKKAEAAGTRAPVKANGLPVKAAKPTSLVRGTGTSLPHGVRGSNLC